MALSGNIGTLKALKSKLRTLPTTVAVDVAAKGAPAMTDLTQQAFASGVSVYGDARPAGVDGEPLTLEKTGTVKAQLRFISVGTVIRCSLGPKYSRYLIGKYSVLPNGGLPVRWSARLAGLVKDAVKL